MALQDILAAITAEADKYITDARTEHQRSVTQLREESERNLAKKKQEIAVSKQQKMDQLTTKAQTHANAQKRNAVLSTKKEMLDTVFAKAAQKLSEVSDKDIEPLLRVCIKGIKAKGIIHPSTKHADLLKKICPSEQFRIEKPTHAKGGFLFVSEKEEQDFTFEHLMEHVVRPSHELSISKTLFS
jgi:vacuolar-type H+-ATPase subunit E/Vma4